MQDKGAKCSSCGSSTFLIKNSDLCFKCYLNSREDPTSKKHISHEEDDIQEAFFNAARTVFPKLGKLLFAVPNGGKRDKKEAVRLKRQGVTSGVSDIICLVPNGEYPFLCLETKTESGRQSEDQKKFQFEVESVGGLYVLFRSAAEGIEILKEYLKRTTYK